jgi:hypothetical protein
MNNLKHIDHGTYVIDKINYINHVCKNPNVKKKEYEIDKSNVNVVDNEKIAYIQLMYYKNPTLYITTPKMFCPFGFNCKTNLMNLQFTNYKEDENMNSFFEFIKNIEFSNMNYIGLTEENCDLYSSQIQYDKNGKYDPTLIVKLPFVYNKYTVDIYNDNFPITIQNIQKFSNMKCDIYIDKIWKYNDKFICKWKAKNIYVY